MKIFTGIFLAVVVMADTRSIKSCEKVFSCDVFDKNEGASVWIQGLVVKVALGLDGKFFLLDDGTGMVAAHTSEVFVSNNSGEFIELNAGQYVSVQGIVRKAEHLNYIEAGDGTACILSDCNMETLWWLEVIDKNNFI